MTWYDREIAADIVEYFKIRYPNQFAFLARQFGKDRNFFQKIKNSCSKKVKEEKMNELCNMLEWYEVNYGNKRYTKYY